MLSQPTITTNICIGELISFREKCLCIKDKAVSNGFSPNRVCARTSPQQGCLYGEFKTLITDYNAYTTCKKHRYTVQEHLRQSHNSTISTVSIGFTVPKRTKRAIALFPRTQHNVLSTNKRSHGCLRVARPYQCPAQCMHLVRRSTNRRSQAAPPASRGPVR